MELWKSANCSLQTRNEKGREREKGGWGERERRTENQGRKRGVGEKKRKRKRRVEKLCFCINSMCVPNLERQGNFWLTKESNIRVR
jgi:hypothetical protein